MQRGAQGDVGHVARAIVRHAGTGLPGGLGDECAHAASGGSETERLRGFIPRHFRDVGQGGTGIGQVRGGPVIPCPVVEQGAADSGYFRKISREGHALAACGEGICALGIAARGAGIARCGKNRDALCIRLLEDGAVDSDLVIDFTASVADAEQRGYVIADGVDGCEKCVLAVDVVDGGVGRDGARPFQIEVGFDQIGVDAGIGAVGNENRGICGKTVTGAERTEVAQDEAALADDGDFLPAAVEAGRVERRDVVDGGEILRHEIVRAAVVLIAARWDRSEAG